MEDRNVVVSPNRRTLAEARVLLIWPNGPGSLGPKLRSFIQQHHRAASACFTFVGHPVTLSGSLFRESEFAHLSPQNSLQRMTIRRLGYFGFVSLLVDCLLTLLFLLRVRRRYDVCIAMGLHLILLGVLLRKFGMVKRAVSVIEEYKPRRNGLRLLTNLYRRIMGFCYQYSDVVVYTSSLVPAALQQDGIKMDGAKQVTIPQPIDSSYIGSLPPDQLKPDSAIWIGQFTGDYGFELVVDAIELAAQQRPGVSVTVSSYMRLPDRLEKMIRERGLEKHFHMMGFIKDEAELINVIRKHRVGLAIYHPAAASKRVADVFRPWVYMASGVPPIINRVPPVAAQVEGAGAGMVVDYQPTQLAGAILALLTDDRLHHRCRQAGLELASQRTTEPVITGLLDRLGIPANS